MGPVLLLEEVVPESEAPEEEGVGQNTDEQAEHCLMLQLRAAAWNWCSSHVFKWCVTQSILIME